MTYRLSVGVFALPTPILVAESRGLFEHHELEVEFFRVSSSREQFVDFAAGRYDLIQTAFDNVANYRLNPGNELGRLIAVRARFASDAGMNLTVMADPEIDSLGDLRGRIVSVDSPDTGFAFVLFRLLEAAGVARDEVTVVSHGGVASRFEKLRAHQADATLLSGGLELRAAAEGFTALASSRQAVDPYLGAVVAGLDDGAVRLAEPASLFQNAYDEALRFVLEPENREDVVEIVADARQVPVESAARMLDAELSPSGLTRTTSIDRTAAGHVLALRRDFDGFPDGVDLDEGLQELIL